MTSEELTNQLMFQLKRVEELEAELAKKERHIATYKQTNQELGDMLKVQHTRLIEEAERANKLNKALYWYYMDDCRAAAMGVLEHPKERPAMAALKIAELQATFDVKRLVRPG